MESPALPEFNLTFDALHDNYTSVVRRRYESTKLEERSVKKHLRGVGGGKLVAGATGFYHRSMQQESVDSPQVKAFRKLARAVLPRLHLAGDHEVEEQHQWGNAVGMLKFLFLQDRGE